MGLTNRFFKRLIASYLLISLIPILTGLIAYRQAMSSAEQKTYDAFNMMLNQANTEMTGVFSEIESTLTRLSFDPSIQALIKSRASDDDVAATFRMYDARSALARNKIVNENLIDLALYCERPNAVVTASHIFISLDRYYDIFFRYDGLTMDQWKEKMLDDSAYERYFPESSIRVRVSTDQVNEHQAIFYVRTVQAGLYGGKLVASISTEALNAAIGGLLNEYEGWMIIQDPGSGQLAQFGHLDSALDIDALLEDPGTSLNGRGDMLVLSTEAKNGWRYIAGLKRDAAFADINLLSLTMVLMIVTEVILLIMLSLLLSRRNTQPINQLVALVSDGDPGGPPTGIDEFDYIAHTVTLIKENHEVMRSQLDEQLPIMREQLLSELLQGRYADKEALKKQFAELSLRFPEENDTLLLLRFEPLIDAVEHTRLELSRIVTREFLKKTRQDVYTAFSVDQEMMAVIIHTEAAPSGASAEDGIIAARSLVEQLHEHLLESGAMIPSIAVSAEPGDLRRRYTRLLAQLSMFDARPGAVQWLRPDSEDPAKDWHWYPMRTEDRLIQLIKVGDQKSVEQLLGRIYEENFDQRYLAPVQYQYLVRAFRQTMMRVTQEVSPQLSEEDTLVTDPEKMLQNGNPSKDFYDWCMEMVRRVSALKESSGENQLNAIYAYLHQHYCDNQLSLGGVAMEFGFSETYFSRMFKAQSGVNYSEYIERLRIQKACELLKENRTVDEIAEHIGYNSVAVFRSAFKRVTGITPSAYKRSQE